MPASSTEKINTNEMRKELISLKREEEFNKNKDNGVTQIDKIISSTIEKDSKRYNSNSSQNNITNANFRDVVFRYAVKIASAFVSFAVFALEPHFLPAFLAFSTIVAVLAGQHLLEKKKNNKN